MWLQIGSVVVPPIPQNLVVEACAHVDGLDGIANRTWWATGDLIPLYWYAGIVLYRKNSSDTGSMVGNVVEPPPDGRRESHVVVTGETAALLDAEFAAGDPSVTLADGEVEIRLGSCRMHSKILLKAAPDTVESVWLYEFVFHTEDAFRTTITRLHAWVWREVMLDTYPIEGSPVTAGPTLYKASNGVTYSYAADAGDAVSQPVYSGSFDVQFDSGCRYSQSLELVSGERGGNVWKRAKARFWTLAEADRIAAEEWATYSDRIVFGGRVDIEEMAGNLPASLAVKYQLPGSPPSPPPPPSTHTLFTRSPLAAGTEIIDLGAVQSDAAIADQTNTFFRWETGRRRVFQATFLGLVPWRMTPFDTAVEWRLPIDGVQLPVTIVSGVESRSWDQPAATVANPAPHGGTITVTFDRLTSGFPGTRQPVGQLTRDGFGSSPAFVPPAVIDSTAVYIYDNLADGSYTVTPGSNWSPTTITVNVVNGSSHTMTFSYAFP